MGMHARCVESEGAGERLGDERVFALTGQMRQHDAQELVRTRGTINGVAYDDRIYAAR